MMPDTSGWRERSRYDYLDDLSVEGLAWECLRRNEGYQTAYAELVAEGEEASPLPPATPACVPPG